MALNSQNVTPFERTSQFSERRRSLFPQSSIDSDDDSDLGCMSPLSNSSLEDTDDIANKSSNNINDYDVIGIVRRELNITPEISPNKNEQSIVQTPNSKDSEILFTSTILKDVESKTNILKTPHDTVTANSKLPKLSHKSVTDSSSSALSKRKLSPYNSPETPTKSLKVDIKNSKVRTTLFPELDLFLPTKKFYSNSESHLQLQKENNMEFNPFKMDQTTKNKISMPCSSIHTRRKYSSKRSSTGKINAGVRHKIRKPRQRKNTSLPLAKSSMSETQGNALKYYLENLRELKSAKDKHNLIGNKENTKPKTIASLSSNMEVSTTDSNDTISWANIYSKISANMELHCTKPNEKLTSVPQSSSSQNQLSSNINSANTNQYFINPFPATQFSNNNIQLCTNPFATSLPFANHTSSKVLVDNELTKKRPLSPRNEEPDQNKKFFKFSRGHKGVISMNDSIRLVVDHGKVSLLEGVPPKKTKQQNLSNFESEDFATEEPSMSQVVMDNILSTLEDENSSDLNKNQNQEPTVLQESLNHSAVPSTCNVNLIETSQTPGSIIGATTNPENLILSPISQMCDVTSGLAINSPKRVKNLTLLMENVTRETKKELLLSPKGNLTGKKKPLTLAERKFRKLHKDQMLLDAGQKKFGVTQCSECNFVYHIGDPSDEACHMNYHEAVPIIKFNGWKNERVVADFQNRGRIIQIKPGDPKLWLKRTANLMEVINREIGCYNMEFPLDNSQIFLYIKNKLIAGCLVAVQTSIGYKMLTVKAHETDLCSERCFPVKCGVARIWVSQNYRKEGIGTALMNALKKNFLFGYILNNSEIAFSSPTEMGKAFAKKYFNTTNFMIYFP